MSEYHNSMDSHSCQLVRFALHAHGGNRVHASKYLGIHRNTLGWLIRKHGIDKEFPAKPGRRKAA